MRQSTKALTTPSSMEQLLKDYEQKFYSNVVFKGISFSDAANHPAVIRHNLQMLLLEKASAWYSAGLHIIYNGLHSYTYSL
jgi:hypothetical protein